MRYSNHILLFLLPLISCQPTVEKAIDINTTKSKNFNLDFGFILSFSDSEDLGNSKTFWNTILSKENNEIFKDSTTEFEIKNGFPKIRKTGNQFELLLYVNDRPNIEKLRMLVIKDNKIVKDELLPYFNSDPKDIDGDNKMEWVGIMNNYEMFGENYKYMPYNPILVYEYDDDGIRLDSTKTIQINTTVYEKFYGFLYSEDYKFEGNEKFETELAKYK